MLILREFKIRETGHEGVKVNDCYYHIETLGPFSHKHKTKKVQYVFYLSIENLGFFSLLTELERSIL